MRWCGDRGRGANLCPCFDHDATVSRSDDIRLSFDTVAEVYDGVRPSYPPDLFDSLFEMLPPEPTIIEVGPGTGQATKDLLDRGAFVHAVEIGPTMAGILRSNLPSNRLRVSVGAFETTGIRLAPADAVFAATAYHWVAKEAQTDRPATILRPGGLVAIVDLIQVESPDDAGFFETAQPIYERYGVSHIGPPPPHRDEVDPPIRTVLDNDARFESTSVRRYDWNQTYSAERYRQLMLSYSVTQMMDEPDRQGLLDEVESLVRTDFGGCITRPLVVTLTTATRR